MSTLFLHIGGPKTGSTYLQSIFRTKREALLAHAIHYPLWNEEPEAGASTSYSFTSANPEIICMVMAEENRNPRYHYISLPEPTSSAQAYKMTETKKFFSIFDRK